jgi:hypothetical protein
VAACVRYLALPRAIAAMACKLARLFDWLVKHEQPYVDKEHYEAKCREHQIRSVKKGHERLARDPETARIGDASCLEVWNRRVPAISRLHGNDRAIGSAISVGSVELPALQMSLVQRLAKERLSARKPTVKNPRIATVLGRSSLRCHQTFTSASFQVHLEHP